MTFDVRILTPTDYDDILVGWWKDWGWTPPPRDFLPEDGTGGLILFDGDTPVCAGFMYASNSKLAWIEFIISNRNYKKKPERSNALGILIETLTKVCRDTGFKYCYATLKNRMLISTYEKLGYVKGDVNSYEMIKKL